MLTLFSGGVAVLGSMIAGAAARRFTHRRRATAAEAANAALLEHQAWVAMAEEAAQIGHWRVDVRTGATTWSEAVYRLYGLDPAAGFPGVEVIRRLYHPDDRPRIGAAVSKFREMGDGPFSIDYRVVRPNGEVRFVTARGAAKRERFGRIVAVFGVVIDVTEIKQVEKILHEREAHLRFIIDHSADTIIRTDADGAVLFATEGTRQRGRLPADVTGGYIFQHVHPEDRTRVLESLAGFAASQDRTLTTEQRAATEGGAWVWTEASTSVTRDDAGRPMEFVTVVRDISRRKGMEIELHRKREEAEAAARAKSEFLANMSHEIRTPLTAINGFAGLLAGLEGLPSEARRYVARIVLGGQALLAVVDDILDFSKLEAGQVELDPQPFDPSRFIDEIVDLVYAQAGAKGLVVTRRVDLGPLPASLHADASRLRQVVLNLLSNAIKFTEVGTITLSARYDAQAQRLGLAVRDEGVGVPAHRIESLFERFSQLDGSISRKHGGTGLGLAICKRLVELMGGEMSVQSREGEGSIFSFEIPAPTLAAATAEAPQDLMLESEPAALTGHILVVDDLEANRELVRALLEAMGFSTDEACGGESAVSAATRERFDLILMDMQMPGMNGLAATAAIRAAPNPNQSTPILALSANVLSDQVEQCLAAGMNDHIAKPIDLAELVEKVTRWRAAA